MNIPIFISRANLKVAVTDDMCEAFDECGIGAQVVPMSGYNSDIKA